MHTLSLIIARPSLIFYLAQYGMATHVALAKVLCYFVLSPVLLLSLLVLARAVYTKLRDEYEMSGAMALVGVYSSRTEAALPVSWRKMMPPHAAQVGAYSATLRAPWGTCTTWNAPAAS
jgi:hypothetical protein